MKLKRTFIEFIVILIALTIAASAQPWGHSVKVIDGWLNAATSPVYYDTTLDSVLYVNLGRLPSNAVIISCGAYTLDGWNTAGHGGPADSLCIGYSGDLDCILNEASCAAAGLDNTLLAAAIINNATDGSTRYTPVKGFFRITSNSNYRAAGKTYFWVTYIDGISEPN